jgi:hypothetical protein
MKKIQENRRPRLRPVRAACVAAAVAVLLCGTALAYAQDWFGFRDVFGAKSAVVADHVVTYTAETDVQPSQQTYTEEEQAQIQEGTLEVPEQADLSAEGVGAATADYAYTLEEMLASDDTLYAIVRVEAQSENADLESLTEPGGLLMARNVSGEGHERELKNGSLHASLLTAQADTAYFLISNVGGQFAVGDTIRFHAGNTDLFDVPLTRLMDTEATISLDAAAYAGRGWQWDTLTVTPISLELRGTYETTPDHSVPEITVTLTDGTAFALASAANDWQYTQYGAYGTLSFSGTAGDRDDPFLLSTWAFSQAVDLGEIAAITIDGVAYTLDG